MGKLITSTPMVRSVASVRRLAAAPLLICGLALPAFSQSAANFDTTSLAPPPAAPAAVTAAAVISETGPISATPSRLVGPEEIGPYLASLSSVFQVRGRTFDVFGHAQDPNAKPVIKESSTPVARRMAQTQVTPFADIVGLIVVTTIMPADQSFLVGTRAFKVGDQIPLSFRGKPIRVQITEVSSARIGFRNLDNGEMAFRQLDMLPAGMTPGTRGITAPGMVADSQNAPLELDTSLADPVSTR